jgi:hypothetical protein
MGDPTRSDGSIMRSDLDGKNMMTIVPPGGTFTPKQLQLEKRSGKLYWSDREGMRVMRANLDGSEIETFVDTSLGDSRPGADATKWCVGIAVDADGGKFYWTQKGSHAELTISFILMISILVTTNHKSLAPYAAYANGVLLAVYYTFEAPLSGMCTNLDRHGHRW